MYSSDVNFIKKLQYNTLRGQARWGIVLLPSSLENWQTQEQAKCSSTHKGTTKGPGSWSYHIQMYSEKRQVQVPQRIKEKFRKIWLKH